MENITKTLQDAGNHFKNKLISGDYEILRINGSVVDIVIDGYEFATWVNNEECRFYTGVWDSFFDGFLESTSKLDEAIARKSIGQKLKEFTERHGAEKRAERIAKLKKELEELENQTL